MGIEAGVNIKVGLCGGAVIMNLPKIDTSNLWDKTYSLWMLECWVIDKLPALDPETLRRGLANMERILETAEQTIAQNRFDEYLQADFILQFHLEFMELGLNKYNTDNYLRTMHYRFITMKSSIVSEKMEEKVEVARIVVDEADGRLLVYAGAGCINTAESIRLARELEAVGAIALSVITPYFLTFSQRELIDHYRQLADSTSLPIVLYNIPARTGNMLQPQSVAELAQVPNIAGIKDSSGVYDNILQYIERAGDDVAVLAGTDSLILSTLMAGGKGAIASTGICIRSWLSPFIRYGSRDSGSKRKQSNVCSEAYARHFNGGRCRQC